MIPRARSVLYTEKIYLIRILEDLRACAFYCNCILKTNRILPPPEYIQDIWFFFHVSIIKAREYQNVFHTFGVLAVSAFWKGFLLPKFYCWSKNMRSKLASFLSFFTPQGLVFSLQHHLRCPSQWWKWWWKMTSVRQEHLKVLAGPTQVTRRDSRSAAPGPGVRCTELPRKSVNHV